MEKPSESKPGDTIILRAQSGGWKALGILPEELPDPAVTLEAPDHEVLRKIDVAEQATRDMHRRAVLRVCRVLWPPPVNGTAAAELMDLATVIDPEKDLQPAKVRELLRRLLSEETPGWNLDIMQKEIIGHLSKTEKIPELRVDPYPHGDGFVISTKKLMKAQDTLDFESVVTEEDEPFEALKTVNLDVHTKDVVAHVDRALALLPLEPWKESLIQAANLHDWGKADWRFQAMLRSSPVFAAMASGILLAKSGTINSSAKARREARRRAELPKNFRHEMLSVQMAESAVGKSMLPAEETLQALTLHLLATHHGYARPFAPVVEDDSPPDVSLSMREKQVHVTSAERIEHPSHALNSGITERFWQFTRHHGWWGLAFLEAVLRLADQRASAEPSEAP